MSGTYCPHCGANLTWMSQADALLHRSQHRNETLFEEAGEQSIAIRKKPAEHGKGEPVARDWATGEPICVGDRVRAVWSMNPLPDTVYHCEGILVRHPAGLFVEAPGGGITHLDKCRFIYLDKRGEGEGNELV